MPINFPSESGFETVWTLVDGMLSADGVAILANVPATVSLVADDPLDVGVFVRCVAEKPASRLVFPLGELQNVTRLVCAHRYEPYWMTAKAGTKAGDVPPETQFLLCKWENGDEDVEEEDVGAKVVLFAPILDGDFRACLQGTSENGLELVVESNDPAVCTTETIALFISEGSNPHTLMPAACCSVMGRMQTGRLRDEKFLPAFADQFGWCTWDAFYQDVSHDKVKEGLESFKAGGIQPRLLILDDGWQSVRQFASGEKRLTAFAANEKFPGDLAPTIRMAKKDYGVKTFLVWHALNGYWGGVDEEAFPDYNIRPMPRRFSPGILHHRPMLNTQWWGEIVGLVSGKDIYRFFQDYHRHLRKQGVDGVKVDTQATIEGIATGEGGRVHLMRNYHEALEGSVNTHFDGNVINCMSCASDMLYSALNSTITRTSTDFWPNKPESHGEHLYVNALVSLWFSEFIHPDWDMFQSGHAMGEFHAMARAISGGPVYVSDKPGMHNFDVLRKLVLPNGNVLRASDPALPTADCLFHDPTREDVLLKIFNVNYVRMMCNVIGVFNARYHAPDAPVSDAAEPQSVENPAKTIAGTVSPSDIDCFGGNEFAVYRHSTGECRKMQWWERWEIELPALTGDVFTIARIMEGFAPIGLADMYNSGGAIVEYGPMEETQTQRYVTIQLRGEGRFLAWCETRPSAVRYGSQVLPSTYEEDTHRLEFQLPFTSSPLTVEWER